MAPIFTGNWFNFGRNPSAGGTAATPDNGMVASGGIKNEYTDPGPGKNYRAHIFVNPGTFTVDTLAGPPTKNTLEFLVLAGGGGGGGGDVGAGGRAGGGAGGLRTNIPGVYAAGDIRSKQIRQIATAVSDGMIASVNIGKEISD